MFMVGAVTFCHVPGACEEGQPLAVTMPPAPPAATEPSLPELAPIAAPPVPAAPTPPLGFEPIGALPPAADSFALPLEPAAEPQPKASTPSQTCRHPGASPFMLVICPATLRTIT